jgi:predicted TIM-barrel fold metal-dependent hydrolase
MRFEFFDANARIGSVPNANPRHGTTVDELLREMDLFGISEAVVWHAWGNRWDIARGNTELMQILAPHRDRLHPAWVIMHEHTGQMPPGPQLVAQLREAGVKLVRLFFSIWGSSQEYLPWAYETLLGALEEARLPLVLEWENHPPVWNDLAAICGAYPSLPVILTNAKLTQWERDWYPLLAKFPNFHIETAGYQGWRGLEGLCRKFGPRQIIFGSRYPTYQVGQTMSMVARCLRPPGERQLMAGGNLRRLLAEVSC